MVLAALSALVWGTGDYCGGRAARRTSALAVTVLSQAAGLPVVVVAVAVVGGVPHPSALGWGAVAGVAGFLGVLLLYRGLGSGSMVIFAPITAATAAVVPMGVGLVLGDRPGTLPLAGAAIAVIAIALVSASSPGEAGTGRVSAGLVGLALSSGVLLGVFYSLVGKAGADSGMWPLVGVRLASVAVGLLTLAGTRTSVAMARSSLRWALVAGPFDVFANVLYLVAARHGMLSLVAPISSLYPVSTVLLAFFVDRERVRPAQLAGLGLAATALVLVAG